MMTTVLVHGANKVLWFIAAKSSLTSHWRATGVFEDVCHAWHGGSSDVYVGIDVSNCWQFRCHVTVMQRLREWGGCA